MNFLRRLLPWRLSKFQTLTLVTILGYVLMRENESDSAQSRARAEEMNAVLRELYNDLIKNDPNFAHMRRAEPDNES